MAQKASPKLAAGVAAAGAAAAAGKLAHDRLAGGRRSRAFRLKDGEPLPEGVERIACGRIDHALDELRGRTDSTPEEAVHEARKDMKKLRGLLRLARGELGDETYRRENECFRDAARRLSGVRDQDVMVETLDALAERYPDELQPDASSGLRQALTAGERAQDRGEAVGEVVEVLEGARERVGQWPLERDGFDALEAGLRRTYRRGRRAFRAAREQPSAENLHEWRKRAKDLWYHHNLLGCAWPEVMGPLSDQAHELSDRLGEDHDLVVLGDWARAHPGAAGGADELDAFQELVKRHRTELQAAAFLLGERLYGERPGAFVRRFRSYWRGWREAPSPVRS